jgi:hypothetical protein
MAASRQAICIATSAYQLDAGHYERIKSNCISSGRARGRYLLSGIVSTQQEPSQLLALDQKTAFLQSLRATREEAIQRQQDWPDLDLGALSAMNKPDRTWMSAPEYPRVASAKASVSTSPASTCDPRARPWIDESWALERKCDQKAPPKPFDSRSLVCNTHFEKMILRATKRI